MKFIILAVASVSVISCSVGLNPSTGTFEVKTDPSVILNLVKKAEDKTNDTLGELIPPAITPQK